MIDAPLRPDACFLARSRLAEGRHIADSHIVDLCDMIDHLRRVMKDLADAADTASWELNTSVMDDQISEARKLIA